MSTWGILQVQSYLNTIFNTLGQILSYISLLANDKINSVNKQRTIHTPTYLKGKKNM